MDQYEIRVLHDDGKPSLIYPEIHLSDDAAIKAGTNLAAGRSFEVWRGIECIHTPLATHKTASAPSRHSSA